MFAAASVAVSLLFTFTTAAKANLLTGNESQLEAWLGQGNLDFTNIFTKTYGDGLNGDDFHAAADGMGATFVLMRIRGNPNVAGGSAMPVQVIGGYNPQSWSSTDNTHSTPNDSDRTAFLYNLTFNTIQRQNLIGQGDPNSGAYQTENRVDLGPTFGGGFDLAVASDLFNAEAHNFSYGGTSNGDGIVNRGSELNPRALFWVLNLEVYTVASVPDAGGTLGLLGFSLFALMTFRRRLALER